MLNFILTSILWILALYGLLDIIKGIIHMHKYPKVIFNGTDFIITVHNQEKQYWVFFLKLFVYKMLYSNMDVIDIIIVDLNSTDKTLEILKEFSKDFEFIKVLTLDEYKNLITA